MNLDCDDTVRCAQGL